ncbi:MAG TPA: phosphoribosylglycinamide formyltransferase [Cryomorphaceae bacterium]|nr:phosphoribosylglycinamide formyltransferase [Cryomorphaceae bacterium]
MNNIAILGSGAGSNALKILEYFQKSKTADVVCIISNKPEAGILEHAKKFGVVSKVFENAVWESHSDKVIAFLDSHNVDAIVLAGFLRKIPTKILDRFEGAIINIHPSLLPKYGGKGMYGRRVHRAVVENGDDESGITIHLVNEIYDDGEILFQAKTKIDATDSPTDVQHKVQQLEHKHFAPVVEKFLLNRQSR